MEGNRETGVVIDGRITIDDAVCFIYTPVSTV